jgi:hypothetical protein
VLRRRERERERERERNMAQAKMASRSEETKVPVSVWSAVKPFMNGGLSGMGATCVIQPVDMIKVKSCLLS